MVKRMCYTKSKLGWWFITQSEIKVVQGLWLKMKKGQSLAWIKLTLCPIHTESAPHRGTRTLNDSEKDERAAQAELEHSDIRSVFVRQVKQDNRSMLFRIKLRFVTSCDCSLLYYRSSVASATGAWPVKHPPVPSGKKNTQTDLSALILWFWHLKACGSHWKQGLFSHCSTECCCHKQSRSLPSHWEMLTICHLLKHIGLYKSPS